MRLGGATLSPFGQKDLQLLPARPREVVPESRGVEPPRRIGRGTVPGGPTPRLSGITSTYRIARIRARTTASQFDTTTISPVDSPSRKTKLFPSAITS